MNHLTEKSDDSTPLETAARVLTAATSVPFVWESLQYEGKTIFDGGVFQLFDIEEAIKRCGEIVDDEAQIVLDLITLDDKGIEAIEGETAWSLFGGDSWSMIIDAMKKHPKV